MHNTHYKLTWHDDWHSKYKTMIISLYHTPTCTHTQSDIKSKPQYHTAFLSLNLISFETLSSPPSHSIISLPSFTFATHMEVIWWCGEGRFDSLFVQQCLQPPHPTIFSLFSVCVFQTRFKNKQNTACFRHAYNKSTIVEKAVLATFWI